MMDNKFRITRGKGFHFPIGKYLVSVQFGYGNYCDNYDKIELEDRKIPCECENAEVAIFEGGMFVTDFILEQMGLKAEGDNIISYATPAFVAKIISYLYNEMEKSND